MLPLSPEFQLRELPESELRRIVEEHVGASLNREMFPGEFAAKVEATLAMIRESDAQREDVLTDEKGAVVDG